MKFFVRFLLLLCFVLLGKSGYMHLNASQYSTALTIKATESGSELVWRRLKATEVDEDEDERSPASKKYTHPGTFCNRAFLSDTHQFYHSFTDSPVSYCRQFRYSPQHRYIMYRVIRV